MALLWQDTIGEAITLATFDRQLWQKGTAIGLTAWPDKVDQFTGLRP